MNNDQTNNTTTGFHQGGSVEPASARGSAALGSPSQTSPIRAKPGERYEMRDPFEEVTYRSNSLKDIMTKAERLGSQRFTAIDRNEQRSFVQKGEEGWQRSNHLAAIPALEKESAVPSKEPSVARPAAALEEPLLKSQPKNPRTERASRVAQIEATLHDRYVIKHAPVAIGAVTLGHTEYRFRGDTSRIAFTESTFKLATDTNSPSVARSMVDVAEARGWRSLKISGAEEFRRMVWMEATIRGVKTHGYEPVPGDLESMRKEQLARQINRLEPLPMSSTAEKAAEQGKRPNASRKSVLAAIEAILVAKGVPEQKRQGVLAAATEQLAQAQRAGHSIKVKVLDKSAPSQRPAPTLLRTPEMQREQANRTR
ncbi:hypothetical protein DBR47_24400 [Paucibacter sp. KBW04]|uniref:LPD7 domain-containing protein n=1 Tax=Paucibacter sp. KBW04 TaxID=2153361 RepID=UPI000F56E2B1|nr:LPD7 domain-containing protein [Paucibacter sp. KBW04]RQO53245.1 hypothetical protein DBR47_24400 [Paucibacter sp. KBW04]